MLTFLRWSNWKVKNLGKKTEEKKFPVKKCKFISAICVGTIYCLTDGMHACLKKKNPIKSIIDKCQRVQLYRQNIFVVSVLDIRLCGIKLLFFT